VYGPGQHDAEALRPYHDSVPGDLARTLIVIPALNEESSVGIVVESVRRVLPDVQCLVVDDGSKDRTGDRAAEAGAWVATLPFNLGVGGAMRLGFKVARARGFDRVVQVDADGQHPVDQLPALIAGLDDADIVIGARFAGVGDYDARGPRRWAMRLLAWALSRVCRTTLTDATSGFRACGPRAVEVFADNYPAEYLGDTIEALVIAAKSNCRVRQVPVEMSARIAGAPSQNAVRSTLYLGRVAIALVFAILKPTPRPGGALA